MIQKGDIYYADLSPVVGSEQGGMRPVLILQNNTGNHFSPTVIVAAITCQPKKYGFPTHVKLRAEECGLTFDSTIMLEQICTIDKTRLHGYIFSLSEEHIQAVNAAVMVSLGIETVQPQHDCVEQQGMGMSF